MRRIMISAMHSGAGKTIISSGLMAAYRRRGLAVRAFKCGPDYIDPMFHSRVLGVPSRNLDLFLQGEEGVKRTLFSRGDREDGNKERPALVILEGAMGFYDGVAGTDAASAWDVARVTETPVILAVKPGGSSLTLAAQVRGMLTFRPESRIVGILLANTKEPMFLHLKPILERETGLPVLGWLPAMAEAKLPSRHLGLMTAEEVTDLQERFDAIAAQMERTVELDRILELAESAEEPERNAELAESAEEPDRKPELAEYPQKPESEFRDPESKSRNPGSESRDPGSGNAPDSIAAKKKPRIAVARDEAFCFTYRDSLDALREAGAELAFFSPLRDACLPEGTDGLYLCGGYPELHAKQLSENGSLRAEIRGRIAEGLPTLAECGGFLYLQSSLEDENREAHPMCGVFSGRGYLTRRLQRFGYQYLRARGDSMLFRAGERIPAHEFHYWDCTENGGDLRSEKPDGRSWDCGFAGPALYAAFPHLHLAGEIPLAERFAGACLKYRESRERRAE